MFEILTAITVRKVNMRHRATFLADRSKRCRDMAVFRFFKMAVVRYLGSVIRLFGPSRNGIWWSLSLCKLWL